MKTVQVLIVWICIALVGYCSFPSNSLPLSGPYFNGWNYATLALLDSTETQTGIGDGIALYTHRSQHELRFRVDLLDYQDYSDVDLYLAIDAISDGTSWLPIVAESQLQWDWLYTITAFEPPIAMDSNHLLSYQTGIRVIRDLRLDTIEIIIPIPPALSHAARYNWEVFITPAGKLTLSDYLGPASSDAAPPSRSNLLLAFWNTFSAVTPAQAVRAWDGAHSGPHRERHGLGNLLYFADKFNIPVYLHDLATPSSVAALNFIGQSQYISSLVERGTIISPPINILTSNIPISPEGIEQNLKNQPVSGINPTLPPNLIRTLLSGTIKSHSHQAIIMGGDFSSSWWGVPEFSAQAFEYIAAHPWIHPITRQELFSDHIDIYKQLTGSTNHMAFQKISEPLNLYNSQGIFVRNIDDTAQYLDQIQQKINRMPSGKIKQTALQIFSHLAYPTTDSIQNYLQISYLPDILNLLSAAEWETTPNSICTCQQDLDSDGISECILSSPEAWFVIEPDGARILFGFIRTPQGVIQVIAPSYQFAPGLSDPRVWNTTFGPANDPSTYPGSLFNPSAPWELFDAQASAGEIKFTSADGSSTRSYRLDGALLTIHATGNQPFPLDLSFALYPETMQLPNWANAYQISYTTRGLRWISQDAISVTISGVAFQPITTCIDSRPFISMVENPNFNYPDGHYLPFPFAVIRLSGKQNYALSLHFSWK